MPTGPDTAASSASRFSANRELLAGLIVKRKALEADNDPSLTVRVIVQVPA